MTPISCIAWFAVLSIYLLFDHIINSSCPPQGDLFVTLKDTDTPYCFLEVYTRPSPSRKFRKLKSSIETLAERSTETVDIVDRHLGKLCQGSVLLTSESEWQYITNGIDRMRRLVGTRTEKKRKRGKKDRRSRYRGGGGRKPSGATSRRCPAKRTPQCSVLHEFHAKHVEYHNMVDKELLQQIDNKACRCRHNTGTRIPCGSKMCYTNGIQQPCGVKYCENLVFDFCASSRTDCIPEKLLADYIIHAVWGR